MHLINIDYIIAASIFYPIKPGLQPTRKKAAKKMLVKSSLRINEHQFITVDHVNKTLELTSSGVGPVVRIRSNNTYVFKLNKKDISAYNTEMLFEYLKKSPETAAALFARFVYRFDAKQLQPVTIPQFYNSFNNNGLDHFVSFFKECTPATRRQILLDHICFNHDAKMAGVISMSTSVCENKYCQARRNNCPGSICPYCYAASLTAQRAGLKNKIARLHAVLTSVKLSAQDIPAINATMYKYFRFESFGDLNNTIQFDNYNLFARVNSGVNFTLWTKNPGIIQAAINNGTVLADNLVIGLSSLYLNTPETEKAKKYSFIRFLFTVYDDAFIAAHNIKINCGAKHCITCGICYKALHENKNGGLVIINERKK